MKPRLIALSAFLIAPAATAQIPVMYVTDTGSDTVWRCEDLTADGDLKDNGEVVAFYSDVVGPLVLGNNAGLRCGPDGEVMVTDSTEDCVFLLRDHDGDGSAHDDGEAVRWFDGRTGGNASGILLLSANGLIRDAVSGAWYVACAGSGTNAPDTIVRLEDLNQDGDANDLGEATEFWRFLSSAGGDAVPQAVEIGPDGAVYLVDSPSSGSNGKGVYRLVDLTADGDANDAGESTPFFIPSFLNTPFFWCIELAPDGWFYTADTGNEIVWRFRDLNADGDAHDANESSPYLTIVAASTMWELTAANDGSLYVLEGATPQRIWRLFDADASGMIGAGEFTDVYNETVSVQVIGNGRGIDIVRGAAAGTSYCYGDGSGTACPCGNVGTSGKGCPNSIFPGGARLETLGAASVANDTLRRVGTRMPSRSALDVLGPAATADGGAARRSRAIRASPRVAARLVRSAGRCDPVPMSNARSRNLLLAICAAAAVAVAAARFAGGSPRADGVELRAASAAELAAESEPDPCTAPARHGLAPRGPAVESAPIAASTKPVLTERASRTRPGFLAVEAFDSETGARLEHVRVRALAPTRVADRTGDDRGSATVLRLTPRDYAVFVSAPGYEPAELASVRIVAEETTTPAAVFLAPGSARIEGRAEPAPSEGAMLRAELAGEGRRPCERCADEPCPHCGYASDASRVTLGADGSFAFERLAGASYLLRLVDADGRECSTPLRVDLASAESRYVVLSPVPPRDVAIEIEDADGASLSDTWATRSRAELYPGFDTMPTVLNDVDMTWECSFLDGAVPVASGSFVPPLPPDADWSTAWSMACGSGVGRFGDRDDRLRGPHDELWPGPAMPAFALARLEIRVDARGRVCVEGIPARVDRIELRHGAFVARATLDGRVAPLLSVRLAIDAALGGHDPSPTFRRYEDALRR